MANAKKIIMETEGVVLELSLREAEVLVDVCQFIGGVPTDSRRGLIDAISAALRSAGIKYSHSRLADVSQEFRSIWFHKLVDTKETL